VSPPGRPEVLVIGEPLLELSATEPLETATEFRASFSGDALNAAAAAAAAGVATALLTRVGDDEVGTRLVRYAASLGIRTDLIRSGPAHTGAYLVGADPEGRRDFVYLRAGSAATWITPADLDGSDVDDVPVLLVSGIAMASSPSLADTVVAAAERVHARGGTVVYDPNYRRRLVGAATARRHLERLAPSVSVAVPSCPADAEPLVGSAEPARVADALLAMGAAAVVVTLGSGGAYLHDGRDGVTVPPTRAPRVVDATGAGDVFAGTLAAGLARGPLSAGAVRLAQAAAALSLGGVGGTGRLPSLAEAQALAAAD
jgi:2-dehydro-3-deoxygluconokinase